MFDLAIDQRLSIINDSLSIFRVDNLNGQIGEGANAVAVHIILVQAPVNLLALRREEYLCSVL